MRNVVHDVTQLAHLLPLTEMERSGLSEASHFFRVGISPYYFCLIDPQHPMCPVRMQAIPTAAETRMGFGELADPLGEDALRPVKTIVHKYPDRVLFLVTDICSTYCRHCTRRRITKGGEAKLTRSALRDAISYIKAHPEVRDVLISGGDPLLLSDKRLEEILRQLRSISHVELIRIGTRIPVCLPMRVSEALARLLRRYAPLFVVTHFNHPKEITQEAQRACERLVDSGVPVENQAVLMRRLNSDVRIIRELNHACLKMRVRPYYLHHMDVAQGTSHFRTPLAKGVEIIRALRGWTSGLAVPHFAVDLPGGGGKVTMQPNYMLERQAHETVFCNYRGERYTYPESDSTDCSCPYEKVWRQKMQ